MNTSIFTRIVYGDVHCETIAYLINNHLLFHSIILYHTSVSDKERERIQREWG